MIEIKYSTKKQENSLILQVLKVVPVHIFSKTQKGANFFFPLLSNLSYPLQNNLDMNMRTKAANMPNRR